MEWSGHAVLEPGRLIYRGRLGAAHQHCHAAVQVVVAAEPAVVFSDVHGHRVRSQAAIIPAGAVHAIDVADTDVLMIYLEPTTAAGRRLASVLGENRCDCATTWAAAADGAR
jgi:gentisate 1,2-dioxygenase